MSRSLLSREKVLVAVEELAEELVDFAAQTLRIPTVNPPGENYTECARLLGDRLKEFGFETEYIEAVGCEAHSDAFPRVNVIGERRGDAAGQAGAKTVHINGHFDVVPVGEGWTRDPFAGEVEDGRLYGRGSADMKCGLVCGMYAAEALRRAGVALPGTIEISGTVDEESGGFAGAAHLANIGRLQADRIDYAIIPEPLNKDRICVGHRGVYWFDVIAHGHIGHGSMPFLGKNAISHTGALLEAIRTEYEPRLKERITAMPVVPDGARRATLNINSILGGQGGEEPQTPCVADCCVTTFDRRFLPEEGFESVREEIESLVREVESQDPDWRFEISDRMIVHPTRAPEGSPLVVSLETSIGEVLGVQAEQIASPGTYDQKHFARLGGIEHCVAYGPGILEQAHQPDEWCGVQDMLDSTKVMALTLYDLLG